MEVSERSFGNRFFIIAIASTIAFVLMGVLVDRLDRELVNAEVVQFDLRVAEMRSAVLLMEANLVAQNKLDGAAEYIGSNPMDWMEKDTAHYLGSRVMSEWDQHQLDKVRGKWFYESNKGVMVYFPKTREFDESGYPDAFEKGLQFGVVGLRSEDSIQKKFIGLRLVEVNR